MAERTGSANRRGYIYRWQKASKAFLACHPLCCYCERQGMLRPATVVDHIVPHKGNAELFWDQDNWQALCKPCHDSIKAKEEHGRIVGCDVTGAPISSSHHWK